jgi:hypothetical protein
MRCEAATELEQSCAGKDATGTGRLLRAVLQVHQTKEVSYWHTQECGLIVVIR